MITIAIIILFILGFVLLAVLTFARDLLATILNAVVGFFRKEDRKKKNTEGRQTIRRRSRTKKKVYSDTDGEYVDFEEVKK
ncbi:MAG: hypothetical protein J5869_02695 [Bacteroidaceae bacterium]|nr:hypothetical protein [Bacteroidaceae bacterium]